jgi:hypothetical protein
MRRHIPPEIMALTVTHPMFERLCGLDERSFLYRSFRRGLRKARSATWLFVGDACLVRRGSPRGRRGRPFFV